MEDLKRIQKRAGELVMQIEALRKDAANLPNPPGALVRSLIEAANDSLSRVCVVTPGAHQPDPADPSCGRCGKCSALRTRDSLEGNVSGTGTCRACRMRC